MVNRYHGNGNGGGGMRNSTKTGSKGKFMDKPGFPSASLPGKSQPSDRSAGVKKLKVHPKSEGL